MSTTKNSAEFKVRCKPEQKDTITQDADAAGMSFSDYVRSVLLSRKKVVFLVEDQKSAKPCSLFARISLISAVTAEYRRSLWTPSQVLWKMCRRNCIS